MDTLSHWESGCCPGPLPRSACLRPRALALDPISFERPSRFWNRKPPPSSHANPLPSHASPLPLPCRSGWGEVLEQGYWLQDPQPSVTEEPAKAPRAAWPCGQRGTQSQVPAAHPGPDPALCPSVPCPAPMWSDGVGAQLGEGIPFLSRVEAGAPSNPQSWLPSTGVQSFRSLSHSTNTHRLFLPISEQRHLLRPPGTPRSPGLPQVSIHSFIYSFNNR